MRKKVIATILVLVMVMTLLPVQAALASNSAFGTPRVNGAIVSAPVLNGYRGPVVYVLYSGASTEANGAVNSDGRQITITMPQGINKPDNRFTLSLTQESTGVVSTFPNIRISTPIQMQHEGFDKDNLEQGVTMVQSPAAHIYRDAARTEVIHIANYGDTIRFAGTGQGADSHLYYVEVVASGAIEDDGTRGTAVVRGYMPSANTIAAPTIFSEAIVQNVLEAAFTRTNATGSYIPVIRNPLLQANSSSLVDFAISSQGSFITGRNASEQAYEMTRSGSSVFSINAGIGDMLAPGKGGLPSIADFNAGNVRNADIGGLSLGRLHAINSGSPNGFNGLYLYDRSRVPTRTQSLFMNILRAGDIVSFGAVPFEMEMSWERKRVKVIVHRDRCTEHGGTRKATADDPCQRNSPSGWSTDINSWLAPEYGQGLSVVLNNEAELESGRINSGTISSIIEDRVASGLFGTRQGTSSGYGDSDGNYSYSSSTEFPFGIRQGFSGGSFHSSSSSNSTSTSEGSGYSEAGPDTVPGPSGDSQGEIHSINRALFGISQGSSSSMMPSSAHESGFIDRGVTFVGSGDCFVNVEIIEDFIMQGTIVSVIGIDNDRYMGIYHTGIFTGEGFRIVTNNGVETVLSGNFLHASSPSAKQEDLFRAFSAFQITSIARPIR